MQGLDQEHNPFRTVVDGLSIEVHAHPAVNLALVHNGVPLITSVEVVNLSDADVVDVKVSVQLFGAGEKLSPLQDRKRTASVTKHRCLSITK